MTDSGEGISEMGKGSTSTLREECTKGSGRRT